MHSVVSESVVSTGDSVVSVIVLAIVVLAILLDVVNRVRRLKAVARLSSFEYSIEQRVVTSKVASSAQNPGVLNADKPKLLAPHH